MVTGRVPENTPWTVNEQFMEALNRLHADNEAILEAIRNISGGGGVVNVEDSIQSILASKLSDTFPLNSVVTTKVGIVTGLMNEYEDYGVLSVIGTPTSLRDLTKFWEPNVFSGHTIVIMSGNFLYFSQVTSNDNHNLFFNTLANSAQPHDGDIYWVIPGAGASLWFAQDPVTIYNARPAGIGTFPSTWFNFNNRKRASVVILNSMDQAISVQLVGNGLQDFVTAVNIGAAHALAIGGPLPIVPTSTSIGIGTNDDWIPYLGINITTLIAPASGLVNIVVYSQ